MVASTAASQQEGPWFEFRGCSGVYREREREREPGEYVHNHFPVLYFY